jgi:hypothetical protein
MLTVSDIQYLETTPINEIQYSSLNDRFKFSHGVALEGYRLQLMECAGMVHEYVKRALERSVDRQLGEALAALGSASKSPSYFFL